MGKSSAFQIKFDKNFLESLSQDENSGVQKINSQYHLALHPAQFNNFGRSVKDELNKQTAKYDTKFEALMLGFQNVVLLSDLGTIGPDNLYIHFDVCADFYIFTPKIGATLKGIVTKSSRDHVGCLLYKTFNVSLPKSECPENEWIGENVHIGNEVDFKIVFADLESRLPYIRGQLLSITDSSEMPELLSMFEKTNVLNKKIKFEEADTEDVPKSKKSKKKKRESILGTDTIEDEVPKKKKKGKKEAKSQAEVSEEEISNKREKRKEKKKKQEAEELDISLEELDIKSLFNDIPIDVSKSTGSMANSEDVKKRKRSKSLSFI
ncbi:DNA-directed RNA polymerase I subunit RPA43 [Sitophilus oryzae]|uniref:DNA-directed RNA polymerase I subunit RPA43 n=1 Tax=Sitophilus oryzae TaxID=7048 RepID=A0A6J2X7K1_SITOR|nr:DNA-directed RNA polymerase I subunit RPA43 [Sitophilus oryzae]